MQNKKTIPCRVCKKMFVPCAYCQSHADTFRWRNFACSIECAKKYIEEATNYRNSLNQSTVETQKVELTETPVVEEVVVGNDNSTVFNTRKKNKKASERIVETEDVVEIN